MFTQFTKSAAWFVICLSGCVASSNLVLAESQSIPSQQTSFGEEAIVPEGTKLIVATAQCGNGKTDGCLLDVMQLQLRLDQREIDRLLQFGGPH
jgi:hypothetical protein